MARPPATRNQRTALEICEPTLVKDPEIYDIPSSHWGIPDESPTETAQEARR